MIAAVVVVRFVWPVRSEGIFHHVGHGAGRGLDPPIPRRAESGKEGAGHREPLAREPASERPKAAWGRVPKTGLLGAAGTPSYSGAWDWRAGTGSRNVRPVSPSRSSAKATKVAGLSGRPPVECGPSPVSGRTYPRSEHNMRKSRHVDRAFDFPGGGGFIVARARVDVGVGGGEDLPQSPHARQLHRPRPSGPRIDTFIGTDPASIFSDGPHQWAGQTRTAAPSHHSAESQGASTSSDDFSR